MKTSFTLLVAAIVYFSYSAEGFPQQDTTGNGQRPATAATTRIPPRDPSNRIIFGVPCDCPFTRQYNPVCGTDGQTYGNFGVLQCAKRCGTQVDVFLMGACGNNNG